MLCHQDILSGFVVFLRTLFHFLNSFLLTVRFCCYSCFCYLKSQKILLLLAAPVFCLNTTLSLSSSLSHQPVLLHFIHESHLPFASIFNILYPVYPLSLLCSCPNHLSLSSNLVFFKLLHLSCPSDTLISNPAHSGHSSKTLWSSALPPVVLLAPLSPNHTS